MDEIQLDSDVKLPKEHLTIKERTLKDAFTAYADAYQRTYVRRPSQYVVKENGFISIDGGAGINLKRMRELTKQMNFRLGVAQ